MLTAAAASRAGCCPAAGAARRPARRPVAPLRAAENDGLSWLDQQRERRRHTLLALFVGCPGLCKHNWMLTSVLCAAAEASVRADIVAEEAAALAEAGTCCCACGPPAFPGQHGLCGLSPHLRMKPTHHSAACIIARRHLTLAPASAQTHGPVPDAPFPAADDTLARKVGLHIRGRASFRENNTDESDPARHQYHMELKRNATAGDAEAAERTIGNMEAAGLAPGPRAYHAYVFAYVKASKPDGALAAIRRCWDAGVVPLPETYAAVVAAHLGVRDLDTAEAVLASNRRAGVDCTRSWQLLVAGLFRMGAGTKAMEAYAQVRWGVPARQPRACHVAARHTPCVSRAAATKQHAGWTCGCSRASCCGHAPDVRAAINTHLPPTPLPLQGEAEGLLPDAALYQALIQHMCSQGDAASAAALLEQMQVGWRAGQRGWIRRLAALRCVAGAQLAAQPGSLVLLAAGARTAGQRPGTLCSNRSSIRSTGSATG